MSNFLKQKFIRLRCKKAYPEAHTHLMIGKVMEETSRYLAIKGRTFHYRKILDRKMSQFNCGSIAVRIIPWENVEIIHELGEKVDLDAKITFDKSGNLVFCDDDKTMIVGNCDSEQ